MADYVSLLGGNSPPMDFREPHGPSTGTLQEMVLGTNRRWGLSLDMEIGEGWKSHMMIFGLKKTVVKPGLVCFWVIFYGFVL